MSFISDLNTSPELPLKSGWVRKRSSTKIRFWSKRFLDLSMCKLKYYHKENDKIPAGILDFNILTISPILQGNEFTLDIKNSSRNFKFRCKTEQESRNWVYSISQHIQNSFGSKIVLPISTKKKFWRFDRISPFQFEEEVETGDLLLFRGKSVLSKMQRAVTRGHYDHVALLIKYPSKKIGLFEVTGVDGVAVLLWDDFIFYQWQNLYSRLTYKKLVWDRPDEALLKLLEFVNTVKGMDYRLSASKLMSKKHDKDPRQKKGFFCSELIATAYKIAGLIPDDKPSSKYWPGDFEDGKLEMIPPAYLECGTVIDFDLV